MAEDARVSDQSASDLVRQLSEQTSTLVRKELQLAQVELQEKGKSAGIGVGLFGGAGLFAVFGVGTLVAAAVLLLATALAAWLAAVIVGAALLLVAGLGALAGKGQVSKATPPAPEQAMASTRRDVDEVKERAHR